MLAADSAMATFTRLLLGHGADPNAPCITAGSGLRFTDDDRMHEYRDVTPLAWGGALAKIRIGSIKRRCG